MQRALRGTNLLGKLVSRCGEDWRQKIEMATIEAASVEAARVVAAVFTRNLNALQRKIKARMSRGPGNLQL